MLWSTFLFLLHHGPGLVSLSCRRPLSLHQDDGGHQHLPAPADDKHHIHYTYAFYATNPDYMCSTLVNMQALRELGSTKPLHVLYTSQVPVDMLKLAEQRFGATTERVTAFPKPDGAVDFYADCLTKLHVFRLHKRGIERFIYLDSDQIVLKNLDHLFDLPKTRLAIPRAWWLDDGVKNGWAASTLMVGTPSDATWDRVEQEILYPTKEKEDQPSYDMEIINYAFRNEMVLLPPSYCVLSQSFETTEVPVWSLRQHGRTSEQQVKELRDETSIVHFSTTESHGSITGRRLYLTNIQTLLLSWANSTTCGRESQRMYVPRVIGVPVSSRVQFRPTPCTTQNKLKISANSLRGLVPTAPAFQCSTY